MTNEERQARIDAVCEEEYKTPPRWFYLSFCDGSRPKGKQWLGGCYVLGGGPATASQNAWLQGCNPGGEVLCIEQDPEYFEKTVPVKDRNRLLNAEELQAHEEEPLLTIGEVQDARDGKNPELAARLLADGIDVASFVL